MRNDYRTTEASRRRAIAEKAHRCTGWLKANGFEVLAIRGGVRQPRILIRPSTLCDTLEGVVQGYERARGMERRYHYVVRLGCMVEWSIQGGKND